MRLPLFDPPISSGKRVLARVDFNVPVQQNEIVDDFRIKKTLPLIKDLLRKNARVVLLSHLTERKTHKSFQGLIPALGRVCSTPITFALDIPAVRALQKNPSPPSLILLENLRAFPGEEKNDPAFAKELATLGDIYINEDFSQSHRPYASLVTLPQFLPSFIGPLFQNEIEKLSEALNPPYPFLLILGGVKFETKLGILEHFLPIADRIFIGGALPFNARPWCSGTDL
ncbi:MAG: phosphoglycerate kinase [Candidatus Sungbacteria bacterium]|nr:phosphoglycerate kinase [Candidatus Sungbacteria bacterium]